MNRVLALLLGAILLSSCGGKSGSQISRNGKETSNIEKLKKRDIVNYLEETGEIQPRSIVKVKFDYSGKIATVYHEEGDIVAKGTKLAFINPDYNQIKTTTSAQISVQRANDALISKRNELNEAKDYFEKGFVTEQKYNDVLREYNITLAEVRKAKLELESIKGGRARQAKGGVSVASPIAGTIIKRHVEIGDYVLAASSYQSGTVLFEIADASDVIIKSKINEMDILNVEKGATVNYTIEALPGEKFIGKVYRIFPTPELDDNVKKYVVHIEPVKALPKNIKTGMSIKIKVLISEKKDTLCLPLGSVVRDSEKMLDYVLIDTKKKSKDDKKIYVKKYVKTGIRNMQAIEITEGLKEGEGVLKSPYSVDPENIEEPAEVKEDADKKAIEIKKSKKTPQKPGRGNRPPRGAR